MKRISAITTTALTLSTASAFSQSQSPAFITSRRTSNIPLQMGLFDGMKEAFSAPNSMSLDAERETPIDRWMGWNVQSSDEQQQRVAVTPDNFVDSMDKKNYMFAKLTKPMGIVFEENDQEAGGIFVLSLSEDGAAEKDGTIKPGDQLVAVNEKKVAGLSFDEALGCIVDATTEQTMLTFFRGTEKQLYGPTGASKEWLDEFIAESSVQA